MSSLTKTVGTRSARDQHSVWSRLLDAVMPVPDPTRLVTVSEVGRRSLGMARGSLADVGLSPVVQEVRHVTGDSTFQVLVPARDAHTAADVLAGI